MNLRPNQSKTNAAILLLAALVMAVGPGCENTDWNWDTRWWHRPQRTVKPVRRAKTPPAGKPRQTKPQPKPAEPQKAPAVDAPQAQAPKSTPEAAQPQTTPRPAQPTPEPTSPRTAPEETAQQPSPSNLTQRPYYQLYFLSGPSDNADRGQYTLKLSRAGARGCASIVEMLHAPMGKSGSDQECYLLYEEPDEFQAAVAIGPNFDLAPLKKAPTTVGAQQAFDAGVGMMLGILKDGITTEPATVSACERLLAEAVQSKQLSPTQRWAAGILAGRLVSEYRFDYPTAASYYNQALQHAEPESLEDMTGRWWLADSYVQQGRTEKAEAVYRAILRAYEEFWPDSHVVKASRKWIKSLGS